METEMPAEFTITKWGLLSAQACSCLSAQDAETRINREMPAGTTHGWKLSERENCGPVACDKYPETHKHYLFDC